jgi:uncharacterized protein YndB with AHSA1/START domain
MKVERSIEIDAPRERVYNTLMDAHCLKDWVSIHKKLGDDTPEGILEKGDELTQVLGVGGVTFKVHWKVSEAEAPSKAVWNGKGPMGTKAKAVYELEDLGEGKTRFHYMNEFKTPGGPLAGAANKITGGASEKAADKTLANLKKLVES